MVKFCSKCKKILPIIEKKCPFCGNQDLFRYCQGCRKIIRPNEIACSSCGDIDQTMIDVPENYRNTAGDSPSTGLNILSFLFPILGLILYLVLYETAPKKANAIKKYAIDGFIICLTISVLYCMVLFLA